MRSKAVFVLSTACLFASVPAIDAQVVYNGPEIPSRFSVGADFAVSQPKGEFADNVATGYGFNVTGLFGSIKKAGSTFELTSVAFATATSISDSRSRPPVVWISA